MIKFSEGSLVKLRSIYGKSIGGYDFNKVSYILAQKIAQTVSYKK